MAKQVWGRHSKVADGTNVPSKQVSVDVWNENLNRKGLLGFDANTLVSAASVTIPADTSSTSSDGDTSSLIKLSGVTTVDTLVTTNTTAGDLLYVVTSGSVTLNDNSTNGGNIYLLSGDPKDLGTNVPTILIQSGTNWYEYGGSGTAAASGLTGTELASNVVTSSLTEVDVLDAGSITSGFGTIDTGSSAISTTGTVTTGGLTIGGDIGTAAAQDWDLIDNTADALSFDSTGKAGILKFVTTDDGEGVTMSGTLGVTGAITGTLTGNASGLSATLAVGSGGTGSTTTSAARTALGVAIGSDVQAYSANTALTTDKLSDFAATSSSELAGTISDETGSGALVFGTGPTITLANGTGLVATTGLTATGTKDGTTFLRGDNTWAVAGGSDTPWSVVHNFADYYYDMEIQTKPSDPAADHGRFYVKEIDSDNDGLFCLIRKNGAFEETQIV